MNSFLIDVPVKTNIWIRPECQRRQFKIIKNARPSVLFVISDGGRNEEEWTIIKKHRKMFDEEIDWNCSVYKLYESENRGMYEMIKKTHELIWNKVDRCIFLEDDILPSLSFFKFCAELLEKYKDDTRISCICGMNHLGISEQVSSDYFFSRQGSIWGFALWKRTVDEYSLDYKNDVYTMSILMDLMNDNKTIKERAKGYAQSEVYEGHVAADEFYIGSAAYLHHQLQIIPKKNLIMNIGCQTNAAHANNLELLPRGIRRVFNMKVYDIDFPLKHPTFMIEDLEYERQRNKILAYNKPFVKLWRKLETLFYNLRAGNFDIVLLKAKEYYYGYLGKYKEK